MIDWMSSSPEEMRVALKMMGHSAYRAEQIFAWLSLGVGFSQMTNLPLAMRDTLSSSWQFPVRIQSEEVSSDGDTIKYLFALHDGNLVEGVLLRYHHGNTLCISSQVGCRMGCVFCASTIDGRVRDLTPGEMLAMVALPNAKYATSEKRGITNIVLMGSGEPLDTYTNTISFIRLVSHQKGMGISPRNISLSTCGMVEEIYRLAEEKLPLTLSLSLHAPNDQIRKRILPIANRYTIEQTIAACTHYAKQTSRRVIVEYALIQGLNDAPYHAQELAGRLRGMHCHVNLIPLNPIAEQPSLLPPSKASIGIFEKTLLQERTSCTVRRALGEDIQGACGQLRRKYLEDVTP